MKKLLVILLAVLMCFSVVACDSEKPETSGEESKEISTDTTDETTAESSEDEKEAIAFEKFDSEGNYVPTNYDYMKLMKVTQWDLSSGYFSNNERTLRAKVAVLMENIAADGFNTVLFQIRPFADSFYKSELYPLSYFVSGSYAKQEVDYDAVQIFVEEAHKANLAIHAWINPMRCMTVSQLEQVTGEWKIKEWYSHLGDGTQYTDYMFKATDAGGTARLYLNVAYEEVRQLIIDGVGEILDNYNVDGIFMDDYFYPEEVKGDTSIDGTSFSKRTDGSYSIDKFRMNNVNALVRGLYSKVKSYGEKYIYGISPNGDIAHAYREESADIYTWCANEGYCDIMYPQFYYGMMHGSCSIDALMDKWTATLKNDKIKLVPILTLHKAGNADQWAVTDIGKAEWQSYSDVVLESLTYLLVNKHRIPDGMGFFCYQYFHGSSKNEAVTKELDAFMPLWKEYEKLVGSDAAALTEKYTELGYDLASLMTEWNARLTQSGLTELF